jgi:hypothetical protein
VNVSVASHGAAVHPIVTQHARASEALARAWRSLNWRHWLTAAGVGVLFGAVYGTFMFLYTYRGYVDALSPVARVGILLNMLTRWVVLFTGVACALAYAIAVLRDVSRRGAIRPRDVALTILVVSAFGSLVVDPIAVGVNYAFGSWLASWIAMPAGIRHFVAGADWLTGLSRMYSQTGEKIFTFVGTVTLSAVYYLKDSRTSDALAVVQLGLSQAQKCRLTEELRSAQAALDPDFLFATLAEVDRRFDGDPLVAQRLLEALIRYLRAALPGTNEEIGTLGQQATLVRAYLEIESIRSAGRVQGVIDVPGDLETRLFAPALILPLVTLIRGDAADSRGDTEILVKASVAGGLLTVEVRGRGSEPRTTAETEATLGSLRQRLGALYGSSAELSFETRSPRRTAAKIVIDDPGDR